LSFTTNETRWASLTNDQSLNWKEAQADVESSKCIKQSMVGQSHALNGRERSTGLGHTDTFRPACMSQTNEQTTTTPHKWRNPSCGCQWSHKTTCHAEEIQATN